MRHTTFRLLTAVPFALLADAATPVAAQLSVGFEGGIASVQDRTGAQPSAGMTLLWAAGEYFVGAFSYLRWFPDDRDEPVSGDLTGDRAINLLGYLRIARSPRFLVLVGAGLGQFERLRQDAAVAGREYEGALTASSILMAGLTARTAFYLKSEVSTPTGQWDARWGSVHLGISLPVF